MTCNVGGGDRVARVVVGISALVVGFSIDSTGWRVLAFVVAGIALLTAALGYCPVNRLLHVNTCRVEPRDKYHSQLPKYR